MNNLNIDPKLVESAHKAFKAFWNTYDPPNVILNAELVEAEAIEAAIYAVFEKLGLKVEARYIPTPGLSELYERRLVSEWKVIEP